MSSGKCEPGCECGRHRPRAPKLDAATSLPADGVERSVDLDGVAVNAGVEDVTALASGATLVEQRAEVVERAGSTGRDHVHAAFIDAELASSTFLAAAGDSRARDWTLAELGVPRDGAPRRGREALQVSMVAIIRRHWRALEDSQGEASQVLLDELADAAELFLTPKEA